MQNARNIRAFCCCTSSLQVVTTLVVQRQVETDSLFLYDDMAGHNDLIVPAHSIRYTYHPDTGLELWQNGQRRAVKRPS